MLVGCDFSSAPSRQKPIVIALGSCLKGRVQLTKIELIESLAAFEVWLNKPNNDRVLLGQSQTEATLAPNCGPIPLTFHWQPQALIVGSYRLSLEVQADNANEDANTADNIVQQTFLLFDSSSHFVYLPEVTR